MLTDYFEIELQHLALEQEITNKLLVPINRTAEVMNLSRGDLCLIPAVHPALLGVCNQRGRLLWVLDLSQLMGGEKQDTKIRSSEKITAIVMMMPNQLEQQEGRIAGIVTTLKRIVTLETEDIKPIMSAQTQTSHFFSGIVTVDFPLESNTFNILDVDAVFRILQNFAATTPMVKL